MNMMEEHFAAVAARFEENTGIKVQFLKMPKDENSNIMKRNIKLLSEDGPTLIMAWIDFQKDLVLVEKGVAQRVDDKLENYKNIYKGLKNGYYVPVTVHNTAHIL